MIGVLGGCLVLLAVVNVVDRRRIGLSFAALVNGRVLRELHREQSGLTGPALLLLIVHVTTFALLLFLLPRMTDWNVRPWMFLTVLCIVLLGSGIKWLCLRGVEDISEETAALPLYRFDFSVLSQVQGLLLTPLLVLAITIGSRAGQSVLLFAASLSLLFYVYRLIRGVSFAYRARVGLFYIIFYLCALEILPLSALIRLAVG